MPYRQVKAFDPSKAGTKPGYCLQNARLGYSIDSKYNSAWEAWLHTERHAMRDYPAGVDVPIYFWYKDANNGHIGVRLANGKFWTDGRIFDSVEAYEAAKAPNFVGWGESVNGVRVIEYVPDPPKPTAPAGHKVFLPSSVDKWRLYDVNAFPKVGNEKAFLRPSQFPPGLTYDIIQYRDGGNTVEIQTQMFGRGKIWIKDTEAQIM